MEIVTSTGTTFQQQSVGGFWGWTVTANNQVGVGQLYQVEGINTPFGRLIDVAVPIPADVVQAMADSINQLQQQLAPLLALIQPFNPNVAVTVTEGDSPTDAAFVPIQNVGAFGSFMTVFGSPDVPWITASPSSITGLGQSQQAQFTVIVNPASLLASGSPYVGHANLQDNRNPPTIIPITVTVTVLPRPAISAVPPIVNLTFSITTMSSGGAQQIVVGNAGPVGSVLNFSASKLQNNSPWLALTPNGGGPLNPGDTAPITLSVVTPGVPLIIGTYTEIVRIFSQNASNNPVDVQIILNVTA
jgi:hypothetical protein